MASPQKPHPRVGVGVFVFNERFEFLIGMRLGSHGAGTLALPGGHLEYGESFEACAAREVLEETGLEVRDLRFITATNDVMEADNKHYVTIFMGCMLKNQGAEAQVMEPEKYEAWLWTSSKLLHELYSKETRLLVQERVAKPRPSLFMPLENLLSRCARDGATFDVGRAYRLAAVH